MSNFEATELGSLAILALVVSVTVFGVSARQFSQTVRLMILIFGSPAVYLIAFWTWFLLIYGQTVPLDRIFSNFGVNLSEPKYDRIAWLSILIPPLLPVLPLVCAFFYVWLSPAERAQEIVGPERGQPLA